MTDSQRVVFDVPGTHVLTVAEILGTPLASKTLVSVSTIPGYTTYTAAQIENGELTLTNSSATYLEQGMRVTYYRSGSSGTTQTTEILFYLVALPEVSRLIAGTDNAPNIMTSTVREVKSNLKFSSCDWTCKYNGSTLAANDTFSVNSYFSVNPSASERKYLTAVITMGNGDFYNATAINLSGMEIQIPLDATDPYISMSQESEYHVTENTASDISFGYFTCNYTQQYSNPTITGSIFGSLAGSELGDEGYDLSDIFKINVNNINRTSCYVNILVKNSSLLDYERLYKATSRNASFQAYITVTIGSVSETVGTKISIHDINEGIIMEDQTFNFPDRTSQGTIQPAGTVVGQVVASDIDIYNRSFSTLTYRITAQTGNVFGINCDSGQIYIVDGSGLVAGQTYEITVLATDGMIDKSAAMTINITRGGRILTWNGKLIQPMDRTGSILRV